MTKVFFDSNVFIDAFSKRDNSSCSIELILNVIKGNIKGYLASKQITDIYYVLRKYNIEDNQRITILKTIVNNFIVLPTLGSEISYCLNNQNLTDFEDDLLDEICKINCIKYFVTSNKKHFQNSKNCIVNPKELLDLLNALE